MDDFPTWSEAGMEYEFEKRLTEDLESMQVTDLIFKAKDYVDHTYEEAKELLTDD